MIVSIHQPNYLPWLGYFRKIAGSDVFVFFDAVQMPMGKSFVSRNVIKTARGRHWLTVPVVRGGPHSIAETRIADHHWPRKHLRTIEQAYAHSSWREAILGRLAPVLGAGHERIADLNVELVRTVSTILGLDRVRFLRSSEMGPAAAGAEGIPEILERAGATVYFTGGGAGTRRHLDSHDLVAKGIETRFVCDEFLPYRQPYGPFEPNLSVVDALLNLGPEGTRRLLSAP